MPLAVVASPETESDLAVVVSLHDAHDIPHIVHNAGFGGLFPGPQIYAYNNRRIMVPVEYSEEAMDALSVLSPPEDPSPVPVAASFFAKFRLVLECISLGWFVPGASSKKSEERT